MSDADNTNAGSFSELCECAGKDGFAGNRRQIFGHARLGGLSVLVIVSVAVGLICGVMLGGGDVANAQQGFLPPGVGSSMAGGGIFAVSGQLTDRSFGLYVIDSGRRSVAVYEYVTKAREGKVLQLRSVRNFGYDTRLMEYNTTPPPSEMADLAGQDRSGRND